MDAKKIALDVVKFGATADEESTRFMRSNEMRLNENFRKLKEVSESIMADFGDYYPKSEVDALLAGKANVSHTHSAYMPKTGGTFSGDVTFQGAIYNQYGNLANTGYRPYYDGAYVSVANNTWKSIGSLELSAGRWILYYTAQFAASAAGTKRESRASTTADSSSGTTIQLTNVAFPLNGIETYCKGMDVVLPTTTTTYYLNVRQDSGGALNARARLYAIRIA